MRRSANFYREADGKLLFLWTIAQQAPSKIGIILLSILPTALALGAFAYMRRADASSWMYRLRWLAALPIVIGIGFGIHKVSLVNDFLYRAYYLVGQKMILMHYAVLAVPLLGAIVLGVMGWASRREDKYDF